MATLLVFSNCEKTKIIITVIGTESTIPTIPQIAPQTLKDRITTSELILSEFPIILGSKKFSTKT